MKPTLKMLLPLALFLLLLPAAGLAEEVEAAGEAAVISGNQASARNQALVNAQRNAVEQGVGLILDSKTVMENLELIQDKVLTSSKGFVEKYVVLEEGLTSDQSTYRVRIKATVTRKLLEDRLSALRILHKKMGQKRLMVVYGSDNANALKRNHGAVASALQSMRDSFNRSGFRLFNQEATEKVYRQIEQAARVDRPDDDLIAMALDQEADILVKFENVAGQRGTKGGSFNAAYATIRVSVYDVNTGLQIADAQVEGKKLLLPGAGPYDWEKALSGASSKATEDAANQLTGKIADYYAQVDDAGQTALMVFKGFDEDEKNVILDYLESTPGFKQLSELKNTRYYLEVELFSEQDPSRLRRIIYKGLKEKGLRLRTQAASRNRMIFVNPSRIQEMEE